MSQLVMRTFDVADKGELNKGEGPLGRRGERTPDHHHRHGEEKGKKEEKGVGGGRKWLHSNETGHKGFLLETADRSLSPCQALLSLTAHMQLKFTVVFFKTVSRRSRQKQAFHL